MPIIDIQKKWASCFGCSKNTEEKRVSTLDAQNCKPKNLEQKIKFI
jgi:hypothetical protein